MPGAFLLNRKGYAMAEKRQISYHKHYLRYDLQTKVQWMLGAQPLVIIKVRPILKNLIT